MCISFCCELHHGRALWPVQYGLPCVPLLASFSADIAVVDYHQWCRVLVFPLQRHCQVLHQANIAQGSTLLADSLNFNILLAAVYVIYTHLNHYHVCPTVTKNGTFLWTPICCYTRGVVCTRPVGGYHFLVHQSALCLKSLRSQAV